MWLSYNILRHVESPLLEGAQETWSTADYRRSPMAYVSLAGAQENSGMNSGR